MNFDASDKVQIKASMCPATRSGDAFYVRGWINDETASVKAQIVDGGVTNELAGLVERDGTFWVGGLAFGERHEPGDAGRRGCGRKFEQHQPERRQKHGDADDHFHARGRELV